MDYETHRRTIEACNGRPLNRRERAVLATLLLRVDSSTGTTKTRMYTGNNFAADVIQSEFDPSIAGHGKAKGALSTSAKETTTGANT